MWSLLAMLYSAPSICRVVSTRRLTSCSYWTSSRCVPIKEERHLELWKELLFGLSWRHHTLFRAAPRRFFQWEYSARCSQQKKEKRWFFFVDKKMTIFYSHRHFSNTLSNYFFTFLHNNNNTECLFFFKHTGPFTTPLVIRREWDVAAWLVSDHKGAPWCVVLVNVHGNLAFFPSTNLYSTCKTSHQVTMPLPVKSVSGQLIRVECGVLPTTDRITLESFMLETGKIKNRALRNFFQRQRNQCFFSHSHTNLPVINKNLLVTHFFFATN